MSDGPQDASDADTIPRPKRFRPGRAPVPPPPVTPPLVSPPAPEPAGLRFTAAANATGTDRDVLLGYQLFLGRDPENSFVIASARSSPIHDMVRGWITSDEFTSAVFTPLEANRPLPHERASAGPDPAHTEWLLQHLALDPIGHAAVRDAANWRDLLRVLVGLPGFPRPHAITGRDGAAPAPAAETSPDFILITIDQPRGGEVLQGRRVEGGGWVIAPSDIAEVSVHLGDAMLAEARFGLPRPDVARRFPHYRQVDNCGFSFSAELPTHAGPADTDEPLLTVMVRTIDGEIGRKGVRVRLRRSPDGAAAVPAATEAPPPPVREAGGAPAPPVRLLIELPTPDGDLARVAAHQAVVVSGWAVALNRLVGITLYCDGQKLRAAHGGIRREDVAAVFPEYPDALLAGWTLVIPAGALPVGAHRLQAVAEATTGETAEHGVNIVVESDTAQVPADMVRATMPPAEAAFGRRLLERQAAQPHFSILVQSGHAAPKAGGPTKEWGGLAATLASLERQAFERWDAVIIVPGKRALTAVQRLPEVRRLAARLRVATASADQTKLGPAAAAPGPLLVMKLRAGDVLGCDALLEFAIAAAVDPGADFFYADEVRTDPAIGTARPFYKPDFAPEMLLGLNYIGRAWCARADLLDRAGLPPHAAAAASDYAAVLRLTAAARQVSHATGMLLLRGPAADDAADEAQALRDAMQRRDLAAEVTAGASPGLWRVQRPLREVACVSIIMPTCGARGLVRRAIATIRETLAGDPDAPPVEIVVIDDLPADGSRTRAWLRRHADVVVPAAGSFNWSRFNNRGAAAARGDVLLFLNDDIEMTEPGWLQPMLEQALRPEAGAVGPKLLFPDGRVQHAGLYLAETHGRHAFRFAEGSDIGPFGIAGVVREVSAVTGACLMVRREVYDQVGGFDEAHDVINNDVDFCLRVRAAGYAIIYTPHSVMLHHELASRAGIEDSFDQGRFLDTNRRAFAGGDPYRHPLLAPHGDHYTAAEEPTALVYAGKTGPRHDSVRNILALKLDHIGDFVTALPAMRLLKQRFPRARLTVLAAPASQALADLEPAIDDIIEFSFFHNRSALGPRSIPDWELAELHADLALRRFDLAIDLRMQPQTRPILQQSGAKLLAGYDDDGRFPWLDVAIAWEGDHRLQRKRANIVERLEQLVEVTAAAYETAAGVGIRRPARLAAAAGAILASLPPAFAGRRLACVHPGVGNPLRQWPAASFAALIDLLVGEQDCAVVLIGSAEEANVADEVLARVAPGSPVVSLAGKLPLSDLPALLSASALFVGNNSGPQHLAARLGVATVGVHAGIVDAREWGPVGDTAVAIQRRMTCGPCYIEFADECYRGFACLTGLRPRDVYAACRRVLAAGMPVHESSSEEVAAPDVVAPDVPPDVLATIEEPVAEPVPEPAPEIVASTAAPAAVEAPPPPVADVPLPPVEGLQGYIETLATEGDGATWVIGWMRQGHPLEFAAVIDPLEAGQPTHPASFSIMTYARADLPAHANGIVGAITCGWRPALRDDGMPKDFCLLFGSGFHLRCHKPLRLIGKPQFALEYQALLNRGVALQQAPSLLRLWGGLENWTPNRVTGGWLDTEASVDRILLVPGLGCFMEGWVLSPLRRVETLRIRVGGVVMALHPHTLTWKPRQDLAAAFPVSEAMAARAGFVGLFESDPGGNGGEPADYAEPVLKVVFEGGASVNWPIPPKVFRRLGQSARLEEARTFFPALEEEPFFPAFAAAVARSERASLAPPVQLRVTPAERVLVLVLPQERCDLFLAFESVARHCRPPAAGFGVAFVASAGAGRSDALWQFREFCRDVPGVAASLMTIADPSHAFALLPDILAAVQAQRFVFVADGVFLTEAGWDAVHGVLMSDAQEPVLFADPGAALGARCFAWSAERLAGWSAGAVAYLGGFHADNGLGQLHPVVLKGAAWCSRPMSRSRPQAAVNRALEQSALAGGAA